MVHIIRPAKLVPARFTKVVFHADFDFDAKESFLYIDEDFNIDADTEARFLAFLRRSTLMKHFITLLSNSPFVDELSVYLDVEVLSSYDMMEGDREEGKEEKLKYSLSDLTCWIATTKHISRCQDTSKWHRISKQGNRAQLACKAGVVTSNCPLDFRSQTRSADRGVTGYTAESSRAFVQKHSRAIVNIKQ